MDIKKVKEALNIGLSAVLSAGYTRYQENDANTILEALEELEKPKQYYPLGMEPQSKTCIFCKDQYTCNLPTHCEGKQFKANEELK